MRQHCCKLYKARQTMRLLRTPGVTRTERTSSTRPSYMSVWMIEQISSGPSATLEIPEACTLSVIAFNVLIPEALITSYTKVLSVSINTWSNSCSLYHGPPVISVDGTIAGNKIGINHAFHSTRCPLPKSNSMYSFLFLLLIDLTDLTRCRVSSNRNVLVTICYTIRQYTNHLSASSLTTCHQYTNCSTCGIFVCDLISLVQMPLLPARSISCSTRRCSNLQCITHETPYSHH